MILFSLFVSCFSFVASQAEGEGIPALDSDFFFIFDAPSTLPVEGIGAGVFARHPIPKGTIICEYRGAIVARDVFIDSNKIFDIVGPENMEMKIIGSGLCATINDCARVDDTYSREELLEIAAGNRSFDVHEGFHYNAAAAPHGLGKMFIVATEDIQVNEEICYPYGSNYWLDYYKKNGII